MEIVDVHDRGDRVGVSVCWEVDQISMNEFLEMPGTFNFYTGINIAVSICSLNPRG